MNPSTPGDRAAPVPAGTPPPAPPDHNVDAVVVPLPHDASAAALARRFLAEHAQQLPSDLIADAQLLVSEIVANAVLHGLPDISMRVRVSPPGIGVAVVDAGPELDSRAAHPPPESAVSGRGLLIVDAVASAWGIDAAGAPPGKSVWFELSRRDRT